MGLIRGLVWTFHAFLLDVWKQRAFPGASPSSPIPPQPAAGGRGPCSPCRQRRAPTPPSRPPWGLPLWLPLCRGCPARGRRGRGGAGSPRVGGGRPFRWVSLRPGWARRAEKGERGGREGGRRGGRAQPRRGSRSASRGPGRSGGGSWAGAGCRPPSPAPAEPGGCWRAAARR